MDGGEPLGFSLAPISQSYYFSRSLFEQIPLGDWFELSMLSLHLSTGISVAEDQNPCSVEIVLRKVSSVLNPSNINHFHYAFSRYALLLQREHLTNLRADEPAAAGS